MAKLETLAELQVHLNAVYGEVNGELTSEDMLVRLDEASGYLFRTLKQTQVAETEKWLVKIFSWLVAFCNKNGVDIQTQLIRRYPTICPHCLEKQCICDLTHKQPRRHSSAKRQQELYSHADVVQSDITNKRVIPELDHFAEMLQEIFVSNNLKWRLNSAPFLMHLAEERAELIEAYRRFKLHQGTALGEMHLENVGSEAADVLAWLLSCWVQLYKNDQPSYNIQDTLIGIYKLGCPFCHAIPCGCTPDKRKGISIANRLGVNAETKEEILKIVQEELLQLISDIRANPEIASVADDLEDIRPEEMDKKTVSKKFDVALKRIKPVIGIGSDIAEIARKISRLMEIFDKVSF